MFTKRIIPCLDVNAGRVVKGVNFIGLRDAGEPIDVAKRYNDEGADELCFLDISATLEGRKTMAKVVEGVAKQLFIPLCVGGGISNLDDISRLLGVGCDKISLNSAAVTNPKLINEAARKFGSQCVVVAVDIKRELELDSSVAALLKLANNAAVLARLSDKLAQLLGLSLSELALANDLLAQISGMQTEQINLRLSELIRVLSISKSELARGVAKAMGEQRYGVYVSGGKKSTGLEALAWVRECVENGAGEIASPALPQDNERRNRCRLRRSSLSAVARK